MCEEKQGDAFRSPRAHRPDCSCSTQGARWMAPGDQSRQSAGREPGALRAAATWGSKHSTALVMQEEAGSQKPTDKPGRTEWFGLQGSSDC